MAMAIMGEIERILVHHSDSRQGVTPENINNWHEAKGFDMIGYHYVVAGDLKAHACRPLCYRGAHCLDNDGNDNSIGLCITGNMLIPQYRWWWEQVHVARNLIIGLGEVLWPNDTNPVWHRVFGHYDIAGKDETACPGIDVRWLFEEMQAGTRDLHE